jgi:uncharacterized protein YjiS (DUF1127 family)
MQHLHHCYAKSAVHLPIDDDYLSIIETTSVWRTTMNPIRAFRNWRMYNETVRELNRLNARQLSDLGISRADIETIARKAI